MLKASCPDRTMLPAPKELRLLHLPNRSSSKRNTTLGMIEIYVTLGQKATSDSEVSCHRDGGLTRATEHKRCDRDEEARIIEQLKLSSVPVLRSTFPHTFTLPRKPADTSKNKGAPMPYRTLRKGDMNLLLPERNSSINSVSNTSVDSQQHEASPQNSKSKPRHVSVQFVTVGRGIAPVTSGPTSPTLGRIKPTFRHAKLMVPDSPEALTHKKPPSPRTESMPFAPSAEPRSHPGRDPLSTKAVRPAHLLHADSFPNRDQTLSRVRRLLDNASIKETLDQDIPNPFLQ
jgi:hypothetical protein